MRKLISLVIFAPIAIVLIVLSVANRHPVTFNLDPFNPEQPFLAVTLPFFVFLFVALFAGLLIGSISTWFTQSKHRKLAREEKRETVKWQNEAEQQKQRADQAAGLNNDIADSKKSAKNTLSLPHKAA